MKKKLLLILTVLLPFLNIIANVEHVTNLLSNKWSGAEYSVQAITYDSGIRFGDDWTEGNPNYNKIVDVPSNDSRGRKWYEVDYNCNWEQKKSPLTNWCVSRNFGDIYARRTFYYDGEMPDELYLACGHDDAPCEYYLNGTLIWSETDGWFEEEIYKLTPDQISLLRPGEENVLAFHVHQNWGGMYADCGLYTSLSNIGISNKCGDNLSWDFDNESGTLTISGTGDMYDKMIWAGFHSQIKQVIIQPGVTSIGEETFSNCQRLTSISISESVNSIGKKCFHNCTNLSAITIPNGVTSIEELTFDGCRALISIIIPDGVTDINISAFNRCSNLVSITLPSSVTTIGNYSFENCPALTDFYCYAETLPSTGKDLFRGSSIESAILHVPAGSLNRYKSTLPWSGFGNIIGEEVPQEVIEITSENGLVEFANRVNAGETSLCANLTADINLASVNSTWVPIGKEDSPYRGTFNGQKHKITGFKMDKASGDRKGLFGSIMNALIQNLSIDGSITYYGGTGVGVIGWSEGSAIRNVHSSLNITINSDDSHHIGGICGSMRTGTKANGCSFSGKITDTANTIDCIGGIGGYSNEYCLYENCANYGTISFTASNANVGGICGYVNNNNFIGVRNCLNVGTLHLNNGTPDFGGAIIGHLRKHANSVFENNYMLNGSAVRAGGENDINNVNKVNAQQLAIGEICYKLNGNRTLTYWYQTLFADENHTPDPYPVLDSTHEMVLYNDAKGYYNANDPDGIRILSSDSCEGICYDFQGRMIAKPQKGINIIRYSDGTSKKVLVK